MNWKELLHSDNFEDHLKHIKMVFDKLKAKKLIVSEDKAHFCLKQVKLLGRIVNSEGIATDPTLIQDTLEFPEPRNPKQALSFLGLCGVFQNYIKDYMHIAGPLYKFSTGKEIWGEAQRTSFQKLKEAMVSAPVLKHADFSKDFVIFSDASDLAGGAVLAQEHNGVYFPVSYASWLFKNAELNYSTTEREMLALIKAVKKVARILP